MFVKRYRNVGPGLEEIYEDVMPEDVWHSVAGGLPNMLDPTMIIQQNSYNTNQVKQTQMRCTKRKHTWSKMQEFKTLRSCPRLMPSSYQELRLRMSLTL